MNVQVCECASTYLRAPLPREPVLQRAVNHQLADKAARRSDDAPEEAEDVRVAVELQDSYLGVKLQRIVCIR
jgi:hypothetical protein